MNQWAVQPKAFAAGGEQSVVVCPKPRRIGLRNHAVYEHLHHPSRSLRCYFSHQVESKAETDILDIILTKEQVNHTQDARFRDEIKLVSSSPITTPLGQPPSSPSSSGRKGGCVRGNFGNSPAVRIEGFDCLDRDSRNCSIPALA